MSYLEPRRTGRRRRRSPVLTALVLVSVALTGVVGYQSLAASSSSTPSVLATEALVDDEHAADLDPDLRSALSRAATDAEGDGIEIGITSGRRSRADQVQLFREAVVKYGSAEEAARWVAVPGTSAHESGDAVDVGPATATGWLAEHGAAYGLCRIYGNEPWHFELRPDAVDDGCPPPYADATQESTRRR